MNMATRDVAMVSFWKGTLAKYNELKNGGALIDTQLYFVLGTAEAGGQIYLGSNLLAKDSNSNIADLITKVEKLEAKLLPISEGQTIEDYVNNTLGLSTAKTNISDLQATLTGYSKTKTVASHLSSTDASINQIQAALSNTYLEVNSIPTKFGKLDTSINEVKATADANKSALTGYNGASAVSNKFNSIDGSVSKIENALTSAYLGANAIPTKFNSLDQSVSTINGTLSKHNASIEALVKDVSAVNNAFIFKGSITAATSTTIKALNGYAYVASEKFTLATSKVTLEVGDMMIVTANLSAETALSALSSDQFVVLERNLNGAVITDGTAATDDDKIAILSGNTVKAHASETVKSLKAYSDTKALDASTWASTKIGDVGTGTVKAYIDSADGALDASIKASIVRLTAIEAKNLIQDTSIGNLNTSVSNLSGTITELESTHLRYITALAASLTWKG